MSVQIINNNNENILYFTSPKDDTECCDYNGIIEQLKKKNVSMVYAKTDMPCSTLLASELYVWSKKITQAGIRFNFELLPDNMRDLLLLSLKPANIPPTVNQEQYSFLVSVGCLGYNCYQKFKQGFSFFKETFISLGRFICHKAVYRRKDFWFNFADCSYKAVGITALVSFLVGLILAFVGALELKTFGAEIYVASMVTIGMTRIMASIMVGIIMAGRTGSSFAATIGTMQVNEEIDALKTFGIKISDYLVTPRMISLVCTIPFLTLLADLLGILGGAIVGIGFLNISAANYFDYSINALSMTNILVGLLHSLIYGFIISLTGCYQGLYAGRDADAVGKATTNAVVYALVWMIIATGILTVLLEIVGI